MKENYYVADMSDGSSRLIGTMEDVKNFLKASTKQDRGLVVTKYSIVNPAFIISIRKDSCYDIMTTPPEPTFLNGLDERKQLN